MAQGTQLERLIERYPVLDACREEIQRAYELLKETYEKKGMLLVCGNGGSGADSEHIVGELMKEFAIRRPLSDEMKAKLCEVSPEYGKLLGEHLQGSLPAIPLTGELKDLLDGIQSRLAAIEAAKPKPLLSLIFGRQN